MKLTDLDYKYLKGDDFCNSYGMRLQNNPLYDRLKMIIEITRNKSVLHIGCCDHIPLIEPKIQKNIWLQKLLDDSCKYVLGVDINQEAVDYVNKNKYSKEKVIQGDVTSTSFSEPLHNFDYILLGEILEHVNNPVIFLEKLNSNAKRLGFEGKYIITVPNALSCMRNCDSGMEFINTDHKYWFTPYTISKVMIESGITPIELLFSSYGKGGNGRNILTNKIYTILEKIRKKPCKKASWRGDQIIAIGMDSDG